MNKNKLIAFATSGLPRTTVKISDGRDVSIRAFAVKELKLLMMANESNSAQDEQVINVLNQCIETEGVDVKFIPSHDIELLYIELYKISKGTSTIPAVYKCTQNVDGAVCGESIKVSINLNNITVDTPREPIVKLANGLVLNMRYPNILEREYFTDTDEHEDIFNLAMRCIDSVDTGTEVMKVGVDVTQEEITEVIEYLDESSFGSLIEFVQSIPTITTAFPLKCPKCGHQEVVTLRGLSDFFD